MRRDRPIRLAVQCPNCGRAPAVRPFPRDIKEKRTWPADEPVQTVKCAFKQCGTIYTVTAKAYHDAA